ncbi:MAG: arsenic resistance N-acetyltransferase ArsN2 [Armatimonadota bacterium]|nr:arsenic resistance N-acetyltransferase ArsN2 [Armatimonadota bacterium]
MVTIDEAGPADVADVGALLTAARLSQEGVNRNVSGFVVAREGRRLVAAACLERHGDAGLLRSVVTAPDRRGQGLAARLIETLLDRARVAGCQTVYLLTDTAEAYFARRGFRRVERGQVPYAIRESEQFRSRTCASAAVMMTPVRPLRFRGGVNDE